MENFLEHNINIQEYITGNKFIDICEKLNVTFCKTDFLDDYSGTEQSIYVTHNSDYHIDKARFLKKPKGVKKWFALNKDVEDERIISLPIGLESMFLRVNRASKLGKYSSPGWPNAIEKASYISTLSKQKLKHDKLIYLNINPATYPTERQKILDTYKDKSWITYDEKVHWKKFYRDMAEHKFVFSPRGNGGDCHRTWEALYLRTIPIVKESTVLNEFKDLPILFIKSWEDISYNYLNEKYEELSAKVYDLSKMKISYWEKIIKECINE